MNNYEGKIILIGYRCTGKTAIGRRLAGRLGVPFFDTDKLAEEAAGMTIKKMVEEQGWEFFREKEREAIKALTSLGKSVIATGGGAVMDEENALFLKKEGQVIWLVADAETIIGRMKADATGKRPSLSRHDLRKETEDTLAARTPVYRRLADFSVNTADAPIEDCVLQIRRFLEGNV